MRLPDRLEPRSRSPQGRRGLARILRARRNTALRCLVLSFAILEARTGRAEPPLYSEYEHGVIQREIDRLGRTIETRPEGKVVSAIELVELDVFDRTDPVPDFLNILHVTSRAAVIRRELLFSKGERFDWPRIDETARNLRQLRQLSLVLIVPLVDGRPGMVRVLVITKDVWSLRLNSDFELAGKQLNYLLLNPSEENLLGTHASVGGVFVLSPYTLSLGLVLSHSRLFGSRLAASAAFNRIFNRETGAAEGSYGQFLYALPLYSIEQTWAFKTGVYWSQAPQRVSVRTSADPEGKLFLYDAERYAGATLVTRSLGRAHKLDLSFGLEAVRRAYRGRLPEDAEPEAVREFLLQVPVSDTRISPVLQLESYENQFLKTLELETLGLQEDFRLGHEALLRIYPAETHLGSSRNLLGVLAGVSYTLALGDGLVRAIATANLEYAASRKHQSLFDFYLRLASPRLGLGRLIVDGLLLDRGFNALNRRYAIGGEDRLRGYPPGDVSLRGGESQRGENLVVVNTEFRTRAIDILSAQCGLAVFFDLGDAADRLQDVQLKQSVGLGLRILFPQVNRVVFRADWAVPLSDGAKPLPGSLFFTFEQAFPLRALAAPDLESVFSR